MDPEAISSGFDNVHLLEVMLKLFKLGHGSSLLLDSIDPGNGFMGVGGLKVDMEQIRVESRDVEHQHLVNLEFVLDLNPGQGLCLCQHKDDKVAQVL